MKQFLSNNKYIVTAIILGLLLFGWYEMRPAIIYNQCQKMTLDIAEELDLKANSNDDLKVIEVHMKLCVWGKGLKE